MNYLRASPHRALSELCLPDQTIVLASGVLVRMKRNILGLTRSGEIYEGRYDTAPRVQVSRWANFMLGWGCGRSDLFFRREEEVSLSLSDRKGLGKLMCHRWLERI